MSVILEHSSDLLLLFNLWYGTRFNPYKSKKSSNQREAEQGSTEEEEEQAFICREVTMIDFPATMIEEQWTNLWFAKGPLQKPADDLLRQFERCIPKFENYTPTHFWEKMAMIVLYDQIPRNLYRQSASAYKYDHIARKIAWDILAKTENDITSISLQFILTVCISLVHTEDLDVQKLVQKRVQQLKENPKYGSYKVVEQMKRISHNHYDRILWFGRIPERNKYLGRITTGEEEAYLKSLY